MAPQTPKEQALSDLDILYDTDLPGVEAVSYTPDGGDPASVTAFIQHSKPDEEDGADGLGNSAEIRVRVSEVTTMSHKDTVVIGSDTWEVSHGKLASSGLEWIGNIYKR